MEIESSLILALVISAIAFVGLIRYLLSLRSEHTVFQFQKALHYRDGKLVAVLEAGRYVFWSKRHELKTFDLRWNLEQVANQEVPTADLAPLKFSLTAEYRIADPLVYENAGVWPQYAAHGELQSALRGAVSGRTADQVLEDRTKIGEELTEASRSRFAELGLELRRVIVRDVIFPGEMKRVFTQALTAQKEGLAALERARGESAALRHLANAAKLLENNPTLLQLRTLQALEQSQNATVVLHTHPADEAAL